MSLRTLNNDEEKLLRDYAACMPIVMEDTHEVHQMTGAELMEMGYVEHKGEKLVPEQSYLFNMPVQVAANHYRRLKRAWLKNGQPGLKKYLSYIAALINQNKKEVNA